MEYRTYVQSAKMVVQAATTTLDTLARCKFKDIHGHKLRSSLPHKHNTEDVMIGNFVATADPNTRETRNFRYQDRTISAKNICERTDHFVGIGSDLEDAWDSMYNERYQRRDMPEGVDRIDELIDSVIHYKGFVFENPGLEDFLNTITEGHAENAAKMVNADESDIFDPNGTHELNGLFTNGEVEVIYRDEEIALLKPHYNYEALSRVMSSRREGAMVEVTASSEAAYVVGVDDTPTGLFGHMVDGTNLDHDQTVTRRMIHDVMGFDRSYRGEQHLNVADSRIRLQGDLAVRKVGESGGSIGQCNVPVDNHLVILEDGEIQGSRDTAPVTVAVPEPTTMSVVHDEHEHVNCRLEAGMYDFYLLTRGVQANHPAW